MCSSSRTWYSDTFPSNSYVFQDVGKYYYICFMSLEESAGHIWKDGLWTVLHSILVPPSQVPGYKRNLKSWVWAYWIMRVGYPGFDLQQSSGLYEHLSKEMGYLRQICSCSCTAECNSKLQIKCPKCTKDGNFSVLNIQVIFFSWTGCPGGL